MPKIEAESHWLRAEVATGTPRVDFDKKIIYGAVLAQEGEFKDKRGRFRKSDLMEIQRLANEKGGGLKSRLGHPTLSDDGVAKHLGRFKNARRDDIVKKVDGQELIIRVVRADLHLADSAFLKHGEWSMGDYVMQRAHEDSASISSSLVLERKEEHELDIKGKPKRDSDGTPLPAYWLPTALHASDIVDTGDAVDGLLGLSADGLPDAVVRQATELLTKQFPDASREVLQARCLKWLERYLDYRFGQDEKPIIDHSLLQAEIDLRKKTL